MRASEWQGKPTKKIFFSRMATRRAGGGDVGTEDFWYVDNSDPERLKVCHSWLVKFDSIPIYICLVVFCIHIIQLFSENI